MTSPLEQQQAQLAALNDLVYGLADSVMQHGITAARNAPDPVARRQIARALWKLRRAVGVPVRIKIVSEPLPTDAPRIPRRTVTQPISRGAP